MTSLNDRIQKMLEEDRGLVDKAMLYAKVAHDDHFDDTGKPFIDAHLQNVYFILREVTSDAEILAAGWLHDTLEDTETTYDMLEIEFGKRVADLVWEVTKEEDGSFPRLKSRDAILIKFADRLSNLSRMETWHKNRRKQYLKKSRFWNE